MPPRSRTSRPSNPRPVKRVGQSDAAAPAVRPDLTDTGRKPMRGRRSSAKSTGKSSSEDDRRTFAAEVAAGLARLYPDANCELHHRNAYELLTAVILSAQCTDKLVNEVTPGLFARFPGPAELAAADHAEIETCIRRIGLFRNKAKAIHAMARALVEHHGGNVPADMDALTALRGVGRKTANVVLGECFGVAEGIVTDTHVLRLSERIGLTTETKPEKVEADLMAQLPREEWILFSHRLIWHGRRVCAARKPACGRCGIRELCRFAGKTEGGAPTDADPGY